MPSAIEEILRFESPIPMASRLAVGDVELCGCAVGSGDAVIVHLGAANRDPLRFDHPSRFDVARQSNRHLAFGWGAHFCLGAALAREQASVVFEELLPLLPVLELTRSEPAWITGDMSVRSLRELRVRWKAS